MINFLKLKYQDYHYKKGLTNLIKKDLIKELNIMIHTDDKFWFLSEQKIFKIVDFNSKEINIFYGSNHLSEVDTYKKNKLQFDLVETNEKIQNIIRNYYRNLKMSRL